MNFQFLINDPQVVLGAHFTGTRPVKDAPDILPYQSVELIVVPILCVFLLASFWSAGLERNPKSTFGLSKRLVDESRIEPEDSGTNELVFGAVIRYCP
ncbi:hypothetical protein M7I_7445 [Glarea lozoyensis 74030]|uniref:Uncharacterized protein n=1 Tax=Glarea lozoyensis (strain ATCC 74030 / MF5533) TaxID=1104152 RepID=H0EXB1_GLAL7|nr:hypothetical protein M7I_7445 [Glarea lozoyensis 74030]